MDGIRISNKEYREREPDLDGEEWRDVKGYEGWYQVSNLGRVKRLKKIHYSFGMKHLICREYILKTTKDQKGYMRVVLRKDGNCLKRYGVHRLVAENFIPNPQNKPQIDHINRVRDDNRLENLRWAFSYENSRNTCNNCCFTINGETKVMADWCKEYGINKETVKRRLEKGMDILSALTNPIMTPREASLCRKG